MNKEKEIETVTLMVRRYCRGVHGTRGGALCPACAALLRQGHVLLDGQVFAGAGHGVLEYARHAFGALLAQRLCALGFVPDIRLFQLGIDLF